MKFSSGMVVSVLVSLMMPNTAFPSLPISEEVPKPVSLNAPEICSANLLLGQEYPIHLTLQIDASGNVLSSNGETVNNTWNWRFLQPTIDASKTWKFSPAPMTLRTVEITATYYQSNGNFFLELQPYRVRLSVPLSDKKKVLNLLPKGFEEGVSKCQVHHQMLQVDKLVIMYGLLISTIDFEEYKKSAGAFPNASSSAEGGCVISCDSPYYAKVAFCSRCRELERQWIVDHSARAK